MLPGSLEAPPNGIGRYKGPHAVVNAHDTLFAVGHQGEPVLDRMETAVSAVSYLQRGIETILQAELRPIVLLLVG
jgi:hypothetical protein